MRRARLAMPAVLVAVATGLAGCSTEPAPAAGDTMLATAFPLTSVLVAADEALPDDADIGEIPMDTRWLPGNRIEVPITRDGTVGVLTVTVLPEQEACAAESPLLSADEGGAVADEVCRTWRSEGRLPVVVPDPDAPIVVDPSDAAR